ncbi:FAD/NAD(P)-binding domain-containing protein [Amylocystis lapponica]|nr:FAD/NAD(P)-binding domain-containing protein [Amylocystis lapponica]
MVNIAQLVLTLLTLSPWKEPQAPLSASPAHTHTSSCAHTSIHDQDASASFHDQDVSTVIKSIAIVGSGSGGLGILKSILDLPEETRAGWEIVLYEQRRAVGGVWLPDPEGTVAHPPALPETPLYPRLHTNTPHPTMTYPHFPYPPRTPLFPGWEYVQRYHADFAAHFNLTQYIRLNHTVASADWDGEESEGHWDVEVRAHDGSDAGGWTIRRTFDHLIVANGHNHYPYVPAWNGTDEWLANSPQGAPQRELLHSVYYRDPEKYANLSVVIVGASASGRDAALQIAPVARVTYQSLKEGADPAPGAAVVPKPRISHFTNGSIVFVDGSVLADVDAVVAATGYENRVPFLSAPRSGTLATDPAPAANSTTARTLTSNLRYVFPLHRHIFSLAPAYPPTALAFVGLPVLIANCPSDIAQGTFVAHALANASLLPPRAEMLAELVAREERVRAAGLDPYYVGHRLLPEFADAQDYQDELVAYVKKAGALPDDGKNYVEPWRRWARDDAMLIARGWIRAQALGEDAQWVETAQTEEEWVDVLKRIAEWQREWEAEHGESALTGDFYE